MVISLAQKLLSCATFRPLRVIKKRRRYNFADWTGCGDARRLCSNEGMFQAFALVWQTAQNGRLHKTGGTYSVSELHVPHRQCLAGISNAFSASFTSIWPSFPRFYCTPNKAFLLCATSAGTDRVQSPGFPKIVYWLRDGRRSVYLRAAVYRRCQRPPKALGCRKLRKNHRVEEHP